MAKSVIDFNDYIGGEDALKQAAKSVRSLKNDVSALSKSVDDDASRINAGFARIAEAIKALQSSGGRLNLTNPQDKKLLEDYIIQVNELKKAQAELKAEEKAAVVIKKATTDAANAATAALKEQQAAFKAATAAGDGTAQKKAAAAILEIKASADQTSRAIRGANSEFTAATGSINELRVQLSKGTAAYNALSAAERDNSEAGKKLKDNNKALSDQLKVLEKGIGDTRRNVGNYGEAFREAAGNGILPFSDSINQALQVADGLKTGLQGARSALFGVKEGGVVAAEGLNIVKVGLISTGIGAFVILLTTLYEYFTKSDDGAEDLAAGLAYLKGAFSVLEGALVSVGRGLVTVFKDPKLALANLVEFIEDQVVNRAKAVVTLFESIGRGSFGGAQEALLTMATGVENVTGKTKALVAEFGRAAEVARELSRAGDALEDLEITAIALNEKQSQQAAKLVLTAKDRNLTEAQRLTNLDIAGRLETDVLNRNLKIENERFRIQKATNAEAARRGVLQDDDRRAQEEQQAKLFRLQGEYEQQQQVIANRRSVLQKTEREEEARLAKEARERELEALRDAVRERQIQIERGLLAVQKGSAAELELKKQGLQAGRDLELINDKLSTNARLLIKEKELVDEKTLADDFAKQQAELEARELERRKKLAADIQGIVDKAYKAALDQIKNELKKQEAALELSLANGQITRGEYAQLLYDAKKAALEKELALDKKFDKDSADADKADADLELDRLRDKQEKRRTIIRAGVEKATSLVNGYFELQAAGLSAQQDAETTRYEQAQKNAGDNAELLAAIEKDHQEKSAAIKRKQAENDRKQALFNIAISVAQAIAAEVRQFGFLAAIPFIAADVALGAIQAAVVLSQPIPAFFKGRRGGEAVPFATVAEKGPELVHEKATGKFRYHATPAFTSLGAGDDVYTAEETRRALSAAAGDMQALQAPLGFGRNLAEATAAIQAGRVEPGGANDKKWGLVQKSIDANTKALKNIKILHLNVNGEVKDAIIQQGNSLTRSMNQRQINMGR